jgi:transcriptional regulator with XRE-family HTH domain
MKKAELLRARDIIKKTGIAQSAISKILNGHNLPSVKMAKRLAKLGYSEETWLYPNKYPDNPYMKRAKRKKAKRLKKVKA